LLLKLLRHGKYHQGRFCLSFWTSRQDKQQIQGLEIQPDPYLALWTSTLRPVLISAPYYQTWQKEQNSWLKNYGIQHLNAPVLQQQVFFNQISGKIGELLGLNYLIKQIWGRRTLAHARKLRDSFGTLINEDYLKFHDQDIRRDFCQKILNSDL